MGKRFFIITLLILLLFTACTKRECRKKVDTVSGDALEIVYSLKNSNINFYKEIPDSLFLRVYKYREFAYSFCILNETELVNINSIFKKFLNIELPNIDFSKNSYFIYFIPYLQKEYKINLNIKLNNADSITSIIDCITYPPSRLPSIFSPKEETKLLIIKTNKIIFRAYEKNKDCTPCN